MAEFGLELTVPPGAVRNHEVEKTPLLARFLLLEEAAGVSGQFEKPDALDHVGLVRRLVLFDEPQAVMFFPVPLRSLIRTFRGAEKQYADTQTILNDLRKIAGEGVVIGVTFFEGPSAEKFSGWLVQSAFTNGRAEEFENIP